MVCQLGTQKTTWRRNGTFQPLQVQVVLIIFLYVEQKILKPEKCLIVVSFIIQVQQIVENSSLGKMSIFFAVLSTIDPDQFILHVQTTVTEFETPPLLQVKWSRNEVLFLLSLYKERENFFKDKKSKKKTLWEEISKEMQEKGYGYSGAQCETKFKNLKQNFTKTVDHNNVSGPSAWLLNLFSDFRSR